MNDICPDYGVEITDFGDCLCCCYYCGSKNCRGCLESRMEEDEQCIVCGRYNCEGECI